MVNACRHVLRTVRAWHQLPKAFSRWQAAYMSYKRWAAADGFETVHGRLSLAVG